MPQQLSNTEVLAYIAETTWGTTPATPTGQIVRHTGYTPKQDKTTTQSNEATTNREIADIIQTAGDGGLTVPFELSYDVQFEDWLAALLGGVWTTNVLKVGGTRKSFTFQRALSDISKYQLFTGAVPSQMDITSGLGSIITGSAQFTSKFPSIVPASIWTATTPAGTNPVMDPIASVQGMQEGGAGSVAGATEFSMSIANGLVQFPQLTSLSPLDIQLGALIASGSFTCYLADSTYWDKFAAHTTTSLKFTIGGATTKKYEFLYSKVKLSKVDIPNPGKNSTVLQKYTWEAFKDVTATTVQVTRTP
jgi:hypothetical protein